MPHPPETPFRVYRRRDTVPAVLVAVFTAGAVPGASALPLARRMPSSLGPLPAGVVGAMAAAGAAAAAAVLVAAVLRPPRRRAREDELEPEIIPPAAGVGRWARTTAVVILLGAVGAPIVVLAVGLRLAVRQPSPAPGSPVVGSGPSPAATPFNPGARVESATAGWLTAAAAIGLVAVVVFLVTARRGWDDGAASGPVGPDGIATLTEATTEAAAAVAGGDPRTGVLRCYAAMTGTVHRSGVAVQASDVPGDLLARAAAAGVVSAGPAALLTGLFGMARFSSQPVTEADRQAAAAALARIRSDLEDRP